MGNNYIEKIHSELICIMDDIAALCNEYNLSYYITAGSLLGAVRHGGFIPWDDDFDIVMPRNDFITLIQNKDSWLPKDLELVSYHSSNNYPKIFAKIYRKGTLFKEDDTEWGIFVDIFPLDDAPRYSKRVEIQKKLINKVNMMLYRKIYPKNNDFKTKVSSIFPLSTIKKMVDVLMTINNNKGYEYYSNFGSQYSAKKQTMPKSWFGEGTLINFDKHLYRAPKEYKQVLNHIYGNNYMEVPPENKRRSHYPKKVIFSDGEVIEFDASLNKVSVEESLI